ncbi:MAG: nucleotide exchange factor GrpE [Clostridia bacterium]|nr:nucleotide exchange factor GrpE [Clostridia bacterium]
MNEEFEELKESVDIEDSTPEEEGGEDIAEAYENLVKENERLTAANRELEDKYLRMAAEYDNFRRRSRDEKIALYDSAVADTVTQILPMIDNLERAELFEDGAAVKDGLVMISKSTSEVLEKIGVTKYGEVGETFDPNLHNAVLHIEDDSYGEGEIVEVFQRGYKKGDKIIRFAMVKTAN